ncbi:class I SAM-dependent methyltransferase [Piscinibacter sp.]|uniref:class I SAM-dependent methyltransferase n=1 Tax=Piscinibacter sp. TaxID=1903157 RepID=UPI002C6D6018|nr:class I SAM-dependent methyltransferase [Albitalea sp.]HUG24363.1 class I SAM-dependent methyltransferase [Albitalea sp.]
MDELERIQQRYRERDASQALTGFWTLRNPLVLHLSQERERAVLHAFSRAHLDLHGLQWLDVGCGRGVEFPNYLRWGAEVDHLVGVDLMHHRLLAAREATGVALAQASGSQLPFADASFDIVSQNVVFSSIVDAGVRTAVAAEMLRVLRPGGQVLWYDAARTRGNDPHFQAVSRDEVERLFPAVDWHWQRLTTDLGVIRRVHAAFGERAMRLFDLTGLMKTHLLGLGTKRGDAA